MSHVTAATYVASILYSVMCGVFRTSATVNSAMMAQSLADDTLTMVGGDDDCSGGRSTTMTSAVPRTESLFSSSMNGGSMGGIDDDGNGNGHGRSNNEAVTMTRDDDLMVSTTIGLTRGVSMVSSMSGNGGGPVVATTAFARGDSTVSSISDKLSV